MFTDELDELEGLAPEIDLGDEGLPVSLTVTIPLNADVEKLTVQLTEIICRLRAAKVAV